MWLKKAYAARSIELQGCVMTHIEERRCRRLVVGVIVWSSWAARSLAAEDSSLSSRVSLFDASRDVLRAERPMHDRDFGTATLRGPDAGRRDPVRRQIDLSPAIDEVFTFLHQHGVPLQEQRDAEGGGPIGVYANFSVGRDVPALSFHLGDRSPEPIGAFYSSERGFRCALVWPVSRYTLRLEAGEDSELGYYGIAGLQWVDPHRPLAIGIGVPMNLRSSDGGVGLVIQLRMNLQ
jgi:hypothetical protein